MTIAGQHTVSELADLERAFSYQVGQFVAGLPKIKDELLPKMPEQFGTWLSDWSVFLQAFMKQDAHAKALIADTPAFARDYRTAEESYQALLRAFGGGVVGGDKGLTGLLRRLSGMQLSPNAMPDFSKTPQPTATDHDLQAYQVTDTVLKKIENVGRKSRAPLIIAGALIVVLGIAAKKAKVI